MRVQDESEAPVRDVGGSLERVKHVTVNLRALTVQTLSDMEQDCQVAKHHSYLLQACMLLVIGIHRTLLYPKPIMCIDEQMVLHCNINSSCC